MERAGGAKTARQVGVDEMVETRRDTAMERTVRMVRLAESECLDLGPKICLTFQIVEDMARMEQMERLAVTYSSPSTKRIPTCCFRCSMMFTVEPAVLADSMESPATAALADAGEHRMLGAFMRDYGRDLLIIEQDGIAQQLRRGQNSPRWIERTKRRTRHETVAVLIRRKSVSACSLKMGGMAANRESLQRA